MRRTGLSWLRWLALAAGLSVARAGEVAVLYDPELPAEATQTLTDQGFDRLSSDLFNQSGFFAAGEGVTEFDSGPGDEQIASFYTHGLITGDQIHPSAQVLDRSEGFRISIDLAIDGESHANIDTNGDGVADVAGFSIAVISSDLMGLGISFWEDWISVEEDDATEAGAGGLLTQAEGVAQSPAAMATLRRYQLEVKGDAYRLRVDGAPLLGGRLRDYRNYPGIEISGFTLNNFDKANSIALGDAVREARSSARIGAITSEAPFEPPVLEGAAAWIRPLPSGGVVLRWDAVPGTHYSLRDSSDLREFEEFADHAATKFTEEYIDHRPLGRRRYFQIVSMPGG